MKIKILPLMAVMAFVYGAGAEEVSPARAKSVAEAWVKAGGVFETQKATQGGSRAGAGAAAATASGVRTFRNAAGAADFHIVDMAGGGVVVIAGDDDICPVIAFSSGSMPDLDPEKPGCTNRTAYVLLKLGVEASRAALAGGASAGQEEDAGSGAGGRASAGAASATSSSGAKAMWKRLSATSASSGSRASAGIANQIDSADLITDMRVEPLLKSAWNQMESFAGGPYCYNYYTPNHYPCGCVATAASQIMRYWCWPATNEVLSAFENGACTVDNVATTLQSVGYPEDRSYNWDIMDYRPGFDTPEENLKEIGKLTADFGIAAGAMYAAGETGAYSAMAAQALRTHFAYKSALFYWGAMNESRKASLHYRETRNRVIYANLDAGMPVYFGIQASEGESGHAVVADGYGFVSEGEGENAEVYEFAHVNVGWGGIDNMWYNLPVIWPKNSGAAWGDTSIKFDQLEEAVFNIHPTKDMGLNSIISGRVLNEGEVVADAAVTVDAVDATTGEIVDTVECDEHGVYSFILPAGAGKRYDLQASATVDGKDLAAATEESIELSQSIMTDNGMGSIGNVWGVELDIAPGTVRAVNKAGDARTFSSLERALKYANNITSFGRVERLEVIAPTKIKSAVTLTNSFAVVCVPDAEQGFSAPADCPVTVLDSAIVRAADAFCGEAHEYVVNISSGAEILFSNIVFRAESDNGYARPGWFHVESGSRIALAGTLSLGGIGTHDPEAVAVMEAVDFAGEGVGVACSGSEEAGTQFGIVADGVSGAGETARRIVNNSRPDTTRGSVDGAKLVWTAGGIAEAVDANACIVAGGSKRNYWSLDRLFEENGCAGSVVVMRSIPATAFTNTVTVTGVLDVSAGDGVSPEIVFGTVGGDAAKMQSAFLVSGSGASLKVSGVALKRSGAGTAPFAVVDGGASFVLGSGGSIEGVQLGSNEEIAPVKVASGTFGMESGSAIRGCIATRGANQRSPSAVLLNGSGCVFEMKGGEISGCACKGPSETTGAVAAKEGARIVLSGGAVVSENTIAGGSRSGDIYCAPRGDTAPLVEVAGDLTGGEGSIGVHDAANDSEGAVFAVAKSVAAARNSASAFFAAKHGDWVAKAVSDGKSLAWVEKADEGIQPVDETEAAASVMSGGATKYYATVEDAFAVSTNGGEKVALCRDAVFTEKIVLAASNEFDGAGFTLSRGEDSNASFMISNVALVAANVVFDGGAAIPEDETNRVALASGRMFTVLDGGSLEFGDGAALSNVVCSAVGDVAPVVVWGGTFTMRDGSRICGCTNRFARSSAGAFSAGAVVLDGKDGFETAGFFRGGAISACATVSTSGPSGDDSALSGAVYAANGAKIYVDGTAQIKDNSAAAGAGASPDGFWPCNLVVQDLSELWLDSDFSGSAGFTEGIGGNTNIFGRVAKEYFQSAGADAVAASAANFVHDVHGSRGLVAKNAEGEYYLVWRRAVPEGAEKIVVPVVVNGEEEEVELEIVAESSGEKAVVACEPVYVASIGKSQDGANWEIVFTNGTLRCKYVLKTSGDLTKPLDEWEEAGVIEALEKFFGADGAEAKKAFKFTPPAGGDRRFWYVEGYDGVEE
ncbi:MAG: C10 family peptidase [Kiritimatiellae bacterium]|nr:C10 family peptidase [Kiritimatiellia bacterium]